jgi:hypothetical protein
MLQQKRGSGGVKPLTQEKNISFVIVSRENSNVHCRSQCTTRTQECTSIESVGSNLERFELGGSGRNLPADSPPSEKFRPGKMAYRNASH